MKLPFLHLEGGETLVAEDVVGIFDMDEATMEEGTRLCLAENQKRMQVVSLASDLPKSIVLVREAYGDRVYISGLSTETIAKRGHDLPD